MRIIVQRVSHASCIVNNELVSEINDGFLLLVGFTHTDSIDTVEYLAKKVAHLRVFEDENGKLNINIMDKGYAVLSISQFTVYGDTTKGNRPSFTEAMDPMKANQLYETFNTILATQYHLSVQGGRFGEHMEIALTNDGPVTILMER